MGEERLDGLRVIERAVDAAAVRGADHHRHREPVVRAIAHPAASDTIWLNAGWMKSANWISATGRSPLSAAPIDAPTIIDGERRGDPVVAELGPQAVGREEHAAPSALRPRPGRRRTRRGASPRLCPRGPPPMNVRMGISALPGAAASVGRLLRLARGGGCKLRRLATTSRRRRGRRRERIRIGAASAWSVASSTSASISCAAPIDPRRFEDADLRSRSRKIGSGSWGSALREVLAAAGTSSADVHECAARRVTLASMSVGPLPDRERDRRDRPRSRRARRSRPRSRRASRTPTPGRRRP